MSRTAIKIPGIILLIQYIKNILQHCCDRSFCRCRPTTDGYRRICLNNTDKSVRLHAIAILLYGIVTVIQNINLHLMLSYVLIFDFVRLRFHIGIVIAKEIH